MNIIGQTKLLSKIDTYYNMGYLPKTLMFIGPTGCGKHTIAKYVAERFGFDFVEIEDSVSASDLEEYLFRTINTLYLIDLNKFTEKQQNIFLKTLEETSLTAYFVLITNSEAGILDTILNRSIKYHFELYTKKELQEITNSHSITNDLAYEVFQTPGKLNSLTDDSFKQLYDLAEKVVDKISLANYGNAMFIATKLNYKDSFDKIDPEMFLDTVAYIAFNKLRQGDANSFKVFSITNKFRQHINKKTLIKETLILNYLTNLWESTH